MTFYCFYWHRVHPCSKNWYCSDRIYNYSSLDPIHCVIMSRSMQWMTAVAILRVVYKFVVPVYLDASPWPCWILADRTEKAGIYNLHKLPILQVTAFVIWRVGYKVVGPVYSDASPWTCWILIKKEQGFFRLGQGFTICTIPHPLGPTCRLWLQV